MSFRESGSFGRISPEKGLDRTRGLWELAETEFKMSKVKLAGDEETSVWSSSEIRAEW